MTLHKYTLCVAALVLLLGATTPPPPPSEDDAVAVSGLVQDHLKVGDLSASMFQEKNYIVVTWSAGKDFAAGAALAKKTSGNWTIVKYAKSFTDARAIQSAGAPAATATALAADLARVSR